MKVFPIGYSSLGAQERVNALLSYPRTLLVDTRLKPYCKWSEDFCKEALELKYGERYRWAGKYLGNENYQGGPIKLADPAMGIRGLVKYLSEGHDLLLLCQCREFSKCHVSHICTMLLEKLPDVEVVRCQVSSLGPCAQCGEPATLASPSGRLQGLSCEKHGYCRRCKTSIVQFVQYHECYVCPCVVAIAQHMQLAEELKTPELNHIYWFLEPHVEK